MKTVQMTIKRIEKVSKGIFICLSIFTLLLSICYIVLVNKAVLNTVAKEKTEQEIASLGTELGEAEFQYIHAKGEVTMDLASSLGYVAAVGKTKFVTRAVQGASVAIR